MTRVPFKVKLASALLAGLMRLVYWTSRHRYPGREALDAAAAGGPVIFVVWHGRFFPFVWFARRFYRRICILTSHSADGELLSRVIQSFGGDVERGDDRKGGVAGLVGMIRRARGGWHVLFAADGPLGPREKLKPGVLACAQKTGLPIVPLSCASRRRLVFKSWDRFSFGLPFSTHWVKFGPPRTYAPGLGAEQAAAAAADLERELVALGVECERLAGREAGN